MLLRLRNKSVARRFHLITAPLAIILVLAGLWFVPRAWAKLAGNTIEPIATVSHNGRRIHLTGPLACDQTQPVFMRVTVTQRSTGAIAEGYAFLTGTVVPQQWQVVARAIGNTDFAHGPATAVALAQSHLSPGGPDDAHQWLVNVTLVEQ